MEVQIANSVLALPPCHVPGCGAIARFEGVVREIEDSQPIEALEYEAYLPMAEMMIREILTDLHKLHPFAFARVHHRVGIVPVGEAAILLDVHASHRAEAFAVLSKFMDRLKLDVPIWKIRAIQKKQLS